MSKGAIPAGYDIDHGKGLQPAVDNLNSCPDSELAAPVRGRIKDDLLKRGRRVREEGRKGV
jgi:hypothetical protein